MQTHNNLLKEKDVRLISYMSLRRAIGWLGIALPLCMCLESVVYCHNGVRASISDYYYSNLGDVFVAILTALAVFFFSYKGYEHEKDNLITTISGIAALGVAFCPTNGVSMMNLGECSNKIPDKFYESLHLTFATMFFVSLTVLLLFYFTKSHKAGKTKEKKVRNVVFYVSGTVMLMCLIWIFININVIHDKRIFWPESIALFAFGFAWLIKGELFLKDGSFKTSGNKSPDDIN